jgi:hypothetical protein
LNRRGIVTQAEDDWIVKRSSGEVLASVTISRFEFQKLDRCAVVEDERDTHAGRWRVWRNQDVLAFERGIQIVDGNATCGTVFTTSGTGHCGSKRIHSMPYGLVSNPQT